MNVVNERRPRIDRIKGLRPGRGAGNKNEIDAFESSLSFDIERKRAYESLIDEY